MKAEVVRSDLKKILIELSDEELKLVSQEELDEMDKSDLEFDGFASYRLVGRLATNDRWHDAMLKAVSIIKQWHGEEVFDIYYERSPEMEPVRKILGDKVPGGL